MAAAGVCLVLWFLLVFTCAAEDGTRETSFAKDEAGRLPLDQKDPRNCLQYEPDLNIMQVSCHDTYIVANFTVLCSLEFRGVYKLYHDPNFDTLPS